MDVQKARTASTLFTFQFPFVEAHAGFRRWRRELSDPTSDTDPGEVKLMNSRLSVLLIVSTNAAIALEAFSGLTGFVTTKWRFPRVSRFSLESLSTRTHPPLLPF